MMTLADKPIRAVVFDCDGVVINSGEDIADAVNATLTHLNLPNLPVQQLISYTGDGARRLLSRAIAYAQVAASTANISGGAHSYDDVEHALSGSGAVTDEELAAAFVSKKMLNDVFPWYLECYYAHSVVKTQLYPGLSELLKFLSDNGVQIGMLTNKPEKVARSILAHFSIDTYFDKIAGPESLVHMKPDPEGLYKIADEMNKKLAAKSTAPDKAAQPCQNFTPVTTQQMLMVGDSAVDIQAGKSAGAQTCAVTGGVGNKEKLASQNADITVHYASDLITILRR